MGQYEWRMQRLPEAAPSLVPTRPHKGIHKDVRTDYECLYGQRLEAQSYSKPGTSLAEAKAKFAEWLPEIESRIESMRAY